MIKITFPDKKVKDFKIGVTGFEIADSISNSLSKKSIAIRVDNEIYEMNRPILKSCNISILTFEEEDGKKVYWHSTAHLMAEAIEALFKNVKFGIGPAIENGFYYDIDLGDQKITNEDLLRISNKMDELSKKNNLFIRMEISKKEAIDYFVKKDDPYKLDLLKELEDGKITFYKQGNFTDLCKGPHVPNTNILKNFKLLNIAGSYWKGDEKNKQLTRIYGISFPKKEELDEYIFNYEEAQKRDHRKLGKELDLFIFSENVGQGLPIWLPNGTIIREKLVEFIKKEQTKLGYQQVVSPHIGSKVLYEISGHYEKYGKDSFKPIKTPDIKEEFLLKPMNCPHHCEVFKSKQYSYRELPVRIAEFGTVYRYEQSGELHGLTRVRGFTQDDAHIFCTYDQVRDEFIKVIDFVLQVFNKLGFSNFEVQISLRDKENHDKYIGSDELWTKAENDIIEAVKIKNLKAKIEYGEAAFYGPKLDFMVKDSIGRKWQLGTIQVDYNLPERFDLSYIGEDNKKHKPVMIHRAPLGSLERFIGILIEHTKGHFPLWIAPIQINILTISEKFNEYGEKIQKKLFGLGFRVNFDKRSEKIGKKILDSQSKKIPYMIILGQKEMQEGNISVRHRNDDLGLKDLESFINELNLEIINN